MDELLREFLSEASETVTALRREVSELSVDAPDPELISRLYRGVHTIKGTCGFLGLDNLESLTTGGEHLLARLQAERLDLGEEVIEVVGRLVDATAAAVARIEDTGAEGGPPDGQLMEDLKRLAGS